MELVFANFVLPKHRTKPLEKIDYSFRQLQFLAQPNPRQSDVPKAEFFLALIFFEPLLPLYDPYIRQN